MNFSSGENARLSPAEAKRAILERTALHLSKQRGHTITVADLIDADVIYLDANNQPVQFSRVVIAWEN